jgi:hypothetical protein
VPAIPPPELADLARLAEGDESVERVLQRIVQYATTLVPGCAAACLTLSSAEGHETAAASDERIQECHAIQFAREGDGPGRETLRWSEPRRSDDLEQEERWPKFATAALRSGFRSCLALPLRTERRDASALNLYADQPDVFSGTTFDVALLFAAQGGVALDNADLYRQNREMVEHLHRTLTTRSVIERAKGMLMSRHGISSEDAFLLLQRESQHSHRKLSEVTLALLEQHRPGGAGPEVPWTPPRTAARAQGDDGAESTYASPEAERAARPLREGPAAVLRPSLDPEPDLRAATLLARLRARGVHGCLAASECCGERDIRICVSGARPGPTVELLCCTAGDPQLPQWHAVRLTGDERTVWRGPTRDDESDDVLDFVEDLLVLDEDSLAGRYRRLG